MAVASNVAGGDVASAVGDNGAMVFVVTAVTDATPVRVAPAVAVRTAVRDGCAVSDGTAVSIGVGVCVDVGVAVGGSTVMQPPWSDVGSGVPSSSAVSTR
jgi:hypothetical protein